MPRSPRAQSGRTGDVSHSHLCLNGKHVFCNSVTSSPLLIPLSLSAGYNDTFQLPTSRERDSKMLQSVKNARYKKKRRKKTPYWTEKLPGRIGCRSGLYIMPSMFSGSAESSCFFSLKPLKSNFSSLSHMNKTGHIKWLRSSGSEKEDAFTGVRHVSELSLFFVHTTFWVLPSVVFYLVHVNYLLLLH